MFTETARYYDRFYSSKDYAAEVGRLLPLVEGRIQSAGNRLLDVACGSGRHLEYLRAGFDVEGLDISSELLELARERNPGVRLHQADMTAFDLGIEFDVVTCLFSSIGYVRTLERLQKAARCMARHVKRGGLLVVEPWFTPDSWSTGVVHLLTVEEPELKLVRMNVSCVDGRLSYFDFHYLIGTPQGVEHTVERHELGLFEREEMEGALADAGLKVAYDEEGISGRGLYICAKPMA
jgi:SAM-dependent methyltransferase